MQIFFRIHLKVYSSNLSHFQYLMIFSHYRRPQGTRQITVISKTFYLQKQVCYTFNSLVLVTEKEGPEGCRV